MSFFEGLHHDITKDAKGPSIFMRMAFWVLDAYDRLKLALKRRRQQPEKPAPRV